MIFVTVGTQGPFDRLVNTVDAWAGSTGRDDVFAQVGPTDSPPRAIDWVRSLTPDEFRDKVHAARVVVSHAGMGTILTALELEKPVLVLPRLARMHEQRNDHQTATARHLAERGLVTATFDEEELLARLEKLDSLARGPALPEAADAGLLEELRNFFR